MSSRAIRLALCALACALLAPASAAAYVGPGAGFAFLGSFLVLLMAFLSTLLALLTWPVRQLWRSFRRSEAYGQAKIKRLVILGLDGMDPALAAQFLAEGKLPNFARLRDAGTFLPLQTTTPPISPVAWSSFQTGVNPGKHNIYDFLARDARTYLPYLSSAQIRDARRSLKLGRYTFPLGKPRLKLLRKGKPFWHYLGEAGIFSNVLRVPITFPPEKFSGVLLSGMCVPDLKGTQGTFSFHCPCSDGGVARRTGGVLVPLERDADLFRSYLPGPENPLLAETHPELRLPFTVRPEGGDAVRLAIDGQSLVLQKGRYSEWVEVKFNAGWGIKLHGICRFYVRELAPELKIYATPVNIHPARPALPLSHPLRYSIYLAKLLGPFATLGLAEDTWALNEGALDDDAFLQQCYLNHDERERMFFDALEKTPRGLVICVFDTTDRVQHMFWRYLEDGHPAARGKDTAGSRGRIEDLYRRMDDLVGRALARLDDQSLLVVLSDHGFSSFQRGVNLNTWLARNGYLALKNGRATSGEWFENVDWERTRAFALGLNGLYLNQQGRERSGAVAPGADTDALKKELREKLGGLIDAGTGRVAIREVFDSRAVYTGPYRDNAPDLIVGYSSGFRVAWGSVTGEVAAEVFEDNTRAWSGDHCIDPRLVPGVLFSSRKIDSAATAIVDVARTALDLFGLEAPAHVEGSAWFASLVPPPPPLDD